MSSEWPITHIGDLADSISDTHNFKKRELIFLNTSDVFNGRILHHSYSRVNTWPGQAKKSIKKGDILFSEIRPANGRYAYVDIDADDYVVSTKLMVIRARKSIIPRFLFHYLTSTNITNWLQHLAESRSGTFPQITFDQVAELELNLPPKDAQTAIATFIDLFNDKINLNRRMNETLEATARAIYKSWFVDFDPVRAKAAGKKPAGMSDEIAALFPGSFQDSELGEIPEGWKIVRLGDDKIFPLVSPGVNIHENSTVHYIATGDIQRDVITGETEGKFGCLPSRANMQPGQGRVWFAKMKDSPKYIWTMSEDDDWWKDRILSTGFAGVQAFNPRYESILYCFISSPAFDDMKNQLATGTTMQALNNETINTIPCIVPSATVAELADNTIRSLYRRIWGNYFESRTLTTIRDSLLPKLISGEIRLKNAKKFLEAV